MQIDIRETKQEMGAQAAADGAAAIRQALAERGEANVILATGASQFEMLSELCQAPDIDWGKVYFFHLDEYAGMPMTHAASFRKYLKERFVDKLPQAPAHFEYIDAEADLPQECARLAEAIGQRPIDVAFIGIGENAHLAFNDPPADFETESPYLVVDLDDACRRQQHGEGWFPTFDDVPTQAVSMSIRHILKSKRIICTVPDERKAAAVKASVEGPVTPEKPGSILQQHDQTTIYLDRAAASQLASAAK
ncbi:glucosamine-6-phosphate deaminase [Lignipirellula cremea]|uniref:Glucosamine-6-phosphate deaminase 1 n=1 Tax=Lignipirellula cremea TaxID=2528010 RepID=A0A518E179_9BACT|nr:glucosamine-6-phosphate deaminase [Lignipirellula cremea]QDU97832.1 Glucosamine-6-phosphate deaminase 1 [Lignipirellula cremea]